MLRVDFGFALPAVGEERTIFCRRVIETGNVVSSNTSPKKTDACGLPQALIHIGSDRGKLHVNPGGFAGRGDNAECAADPESLPE